MRSAAGLALALVLFHSCAQLAEARTLRRALQDSGNDPSSAIANAAPANSAAPPSPPAPPTDAPTVSANTTSPLAPAVSAEAKRGNWFSRHRGLYIAVFSVGSVLAANGMAFGIGLGGGWWSVSSAGKWVLGRCNCACCYNETIMSIALAVTIGVAVFMGQALTAGVILAAFLVGVLLGLPIGWIAAKIVATFPAKEQTPASSDDAETVKLESKKVTCTSSEDASAACTTATSSSSPEPEAAEPVAAAAQAAVAPATSPIRRQQVPAETV